MHDYWLSRFVYFYAANVKDSLPNQEKIFS